jgi:UDP-N-acetylglucosamine 2-epimerase
VHITSSLEAILNLVSKTRYPVYFPASYRTQKEIRRLGITLPANLCMVDPIGYEEILCLMVNSRGVITDSGTVVEETCVLQIPSVQMRKSTERPQVYDAGSSVKFDPADPENYPVETVLRKLESMHGKKWQHTLGDGKASERIAADLHRRVVDNDFGRHKPDQYHLPIERSYRGDGL